MQAPKRRAGESQAEFNRRRVDYYANRRALENAFNDDEEEVDIRDLTAGSPNSKRAEVEDIDIGGDWDNFVKSKAKKPSRLRNPANSNRFYYEDRMKSSKPSGDKNIWEGLDIPSEYVYDDFVVDDSWRRDNNGSVRDSGRKVTPKNDELRREKRADNKKATMNPEGRTVLTPGDYTKNIGKKNDWEVDTGSNRRPRRVTEGGKGIKQNGPASSLSEDRILGGEDRIYGNEDRVLGGDNSPRRTTGEKRASNNFDSGRVGYVTEDDAPKKRPTNWITTRDGKIAEANSTQTETKGEKRSARPETRSILEDGFRSKQKREKRASGKVASFRGIRP